MATFKDIVKDVINESSNKYLKCFYTIDVHIDEANQQADNISAFQQVNPVAAPAPVTPLTQSGTAPASPGAPEVPSSEPVSPEEPTPFIKEEVINEKKKGEIVIKEEEGLQIQTVDDLIAFLTKHHHSEQTMMERVLDKPGTKKTGTLLNELTSDLILVAIGSNTDKKLTDIVGKNDSFFFDISYGKDRDDSIGFNLSKSSGNNNFSLSLKQNGKILTNPFNLNALNSQIVYYRNLMED